MIRLCFWGTRGSIVSPGTAMMRYGGNTSCVQIIGYDGLEPGGASAHVNPHIVIDGGTGISMLQPVLMKGPWGRSKGELHILLSHYHWDHIIGLPFFAPLFFKGNRIVFYGSDVENLKSSIERLFTSVYSPIKGTKNLSATIEYQKVESEGMKISGFDVRTCRTNHPAETTAYRLEYGGNSVVYATDHEAGNPDRDESLVGFAAGSDLLIIDAQYTKDQKNVCSGYGHSSNIEAVELALAAGVAQVVLFHHNPGHDDRMLDMMRREAEERVKDSSLKVMMARDGMLVELGRNAKVDKISGYNVSCGEC